MCPNNLVGTVDLFMVTHHGLAQSNNDALIQGVRPRAALMQNGTRKGGAVAVFETLRKSPGFEDVWQLHWSYAAGIEHNAPGVFIANVDDAADDRRSIDGAAGRRGGRGGRGGGAPGGGAPGGPGAPAGRRRSCPGRPRRHRQRPPARRTRRRRRSAAPPRVEQCLPRADRVDRAVPVGPAAVAVAAAAQRRTRRPTTSRSRRTPTARSRSPTRGTASARRIRSARTRRRQKADGRSTGCLTLLPSALSLCFSPATSSVNSQSGSGTPTRLSW